jgi:DNA polymerase alpha-associated DNA helicase A
VYFYPHPCAGTGKTHTLIEIIRQLTVITPVNPRPLRLLVCGASNLSVDNILERLLALPVPPQGERLTVTRIGHPARVIPHEGALNSTLEAQAERSDEVRILQVHVLFVGIPYIYKAALARDVKAELETALAVLSGKGKGGKLPRGPERKKMWEEANALRKEYA